MIELNQSERTLIRKAAHAAGSGARPVVIVPGDAKPHWAGLGYYWETRGGREIFYPSAYSKVGWSNMVYCSATSCIEVGENFLRHYGLGREV